MWLLYRRNDVGSADVTDGSGKAITTSVFAAFKNEGSMTANVVSEE